MVNNKAFRFWSDAERKKITEQIVDYWMSDTELTQKNIFARFHNVSTAVISKILNDTDDPPKVRVKRRGFSQRTLKGIKTPERKPHRYTY